MYQHRYLITHSWMLKKSSYGLKSEHLKALEDIRMDFVIIIKCLLLYILPTCFLNCQRHLSSVFHVLFKEKKLCMWCALSNSEMSQNRVSLWGKKDVIYINAFGSTFIQSDLQCIQSIHI